MKKSILILFLALSMFSISDAQPNLNIDSKYFNYISNIKYNPNLQHDRFIASISSQKYSQSGRPTEDVYQYWSLDNNRWENNVRYTYEYATGKTYDNFPNLMTMREWFWCNVNNIWDLNSYTNYTWNSNGTIQSWLKSDAYGGPLARISYTYDVLGDGTQVFRSHSVLNGSSWQEDWRQITANNQEGYPIQTEYFECTNGSCAPISAWNYSYSTTPGYPDNITYCEYANTVNNTYMPVYQWRFDSSCGTDIPPFTRGFGWDYGETKVWFFGTPDNGATWELQSSEETTYNNNCVPETFRMYDDNGELLLEIVVSSSKSGGKIKTRAVLDNSDVRIVRAESKSFNGSNWINSSRNWYSFEGIQMSSGAEITIPDEFSLDQNYPNPFNPSTTITFDLSEDSNVKISIYDMTGRLIKELVNEAMTIGSKTINWDGKDHVGNYVSGGVYLYNLQTDKYNETKKMILMR